MKLSLVLIVCSALQSNCISPINTGLQYDSWYNCMVAGYQQSKEFIEASSPEQINKNQLYIKFFCSENIEGDNT